MATDNTDVQDIDDTTDDEFVDFDPLEDFDFSDDIDDEDESGSALPEGPYNLPNADAPQSFKGKAHSFANGESASERIDALFDQMPTLQRMLYGILGECESPIDDAQLEECINKLKEHHHCVYEPSTLCNLLERAGAISQTDAEGVLLKEIEREPLKVVIDGTEFWQVAPAPTVFWNMTEAGRTKYAAYQPLQDIAACFENEPQYAEVLTTTMQLCAAEGGATARSIDDIIGDDPAVQQPKRYAMYFIDKLERAGAIEWGDSWTITDDGKEYLNILSAAEDDTRTAD
jgi:hypothetical protein